MDEYISKQSAIRSLSNEIVFHVGLCPNSEPKPHQENLELTDASDLEFHKMFQNEFDEEIPGAIDVVNKLTMDSFLLLNTSIITPKTDHIFGGLIHYVYTCWAKDRGVILTPDMIFFTIVSELKEFALSNPKKFQHLCTDSDTKEPIKVVKHQTQRVSILTCPLRDKVNLTIDKLIDALRENISHTDLFDLITNTTFSTAPTHFQQVMSIAVADMAVPYYEYISSSCKLPSVTVRGTFSDWTKLQKAINKLADIFLAGDTTALVEPAIAPNSDRGDPVIDKYLIKQQQLIQNIMDAAFINLDTKFFSEIFSHESRTSHTSEPVIIKGWIKNFYVNQPQHIHGYSSHTTCLSYTDDNEINPKYYCYLSGLTTGVDIGGDICPHYDIYHAQIIGPDSEAIYQTLTNN